MMNLIHCYIGKTMRETMGDNATSMIIKNIKINQTIAVSGFINTKIQGIITTSFLCHDYYYYYCTLLLNALYQYNTIQYNTIQYNIIQLIYLIMESILISLYIYSLINILFINKLLMMTMKM